MLPTAFHTARCRPPRSWLRREPGPQLPRLWEKGYRHGGTEFVLQVLLPGFFQCSSDFFLCIVLFSLSATILIFVDIWFVLLLCNDVFQFCWLLHCMLSDISSLYVELNPQVKERQKLEGCKARLYVRPVAFDMYEGIFHNDGLLDWNPVCVCTQHRMYASPSDTWRLTSVGGIHWPPRWALQCSKYAAAIPPMLNGFCSPCGNDFLERFCLQCYEQAMCA